MKNASFNMDNLPLVVIKRLLRDKSSGKNIIWATEDYSALGESFSAAKEIYPSLIMRGNGCLIRPRASKAMKTQSSRTKTRAEVFTPIWLCNQMNNLCDAEWFGYNDVFNIQTEKQWVPTKDRILFPTNKTWMQYVDSRRLEIACGEAPYLISRYDTITGVPIELEHRIGILDRKLRIVGENTQTESEWLKWAVRAVQSVYGFEYQGDNLFLARTNTLLTFSDYLTYHWGRVPTTKELLYLANIIAWNLWQMDGLKGCLPVVPFDNVLPCQLSLFEDPSIQTCAISGTHCKIYDWRQNRSILYKTLQKGVFHK